MRNNLKHTIKVGIDKNPDFFKPLAQRLEELLQEYAAKRMTQTQLLLAFSNIQDDIIKQQQEGEEKGFVSERSKAIFASMKTIFDGDAEDATKGLFELIKGELNIIDWENKGRVKKDIENKIKRMLQSKLDAKEAKDKAREMVDVLVKNKG